MFNVIMAIILSISMGTCYNSSSISEITKSIELIKSSISNINTHLSELSEQKLKFIKHETKIIRLMKMMNRLNHSITNITNYISNESLKNVGYKANLLVKSSNHSKLIYLCVGEI